MTLIIIAIIVVIAFIAVGIYNGLVKLRNTSEQAWADVDVQLQRRYDLIPNLVETVKGYASHEKETFEKMRDELMNRKNSSEGRCSRDGIARAAAHIVRLINFV